MPETTDEGTVIRSRSGLYLLGYGSTLTPCRASYYTSTGQLFSVHGNTVYEWDYLGNRTSRGTISTSTGHISMTDNGYSLVIVVHLINGYTVGLTSGAPTLISDVNFPANPVGAAYMDGAVIVGSSDGSFSISAIDDATDWTPQQTASAESSADDLYNIRVSGRFLYLLGARTIEKWYPTIGADFPFERVSGETLSIGIAGQQACCVGSGAVFIAASSDAGRGTAWMIGPGGTQKISTPSIESLMTTDYPLSWDLSFHNDAGHSFAVYHNESISITLVYDVKENAWFEADSYVSSTYTGFRAYHVMNAFSATGQYPYAFDRYHDGIWSLRPRVNAEGSTSIRRIYEMPAVGDGTSPMVHKSVTIDLWVQADNIADMTLSPVLSWTDDGGSTWNSGITFSRALSISSSQTIRFKALRLGPSRRRIYRLTFTGPAARIHIKNFDVELENGGR